jgi:catechol 2,3-dioxygenase
VIAATDLDQAPTAIPVRFGPRRLGHVNLYVSDLERSFAFYNGVLGLTLAFDEKELLARFLSNGNSHHDVALMQTTEHQLHGRDGKPQGTPGRAAGLNHIAFEMATEAELVDGVRRARAAGTDDGHYLDHQISRSVYVHATDGVEIEFYSDRTKDWRGTYAGLGTELMSERWDPFAAPASTSVNYTEDLVHEPAVNGLARPLRTARAAVMVADLDVARDFYRQTGGLGVLAEDLGDGRWSILCGSLGLPDLLLIERRADESLGFHHFGLELESMAELTATEARLHAAGVPIERIVATPRKRGLVLVDPDGMRVELFAATGPAGTLPAYADIADESNREYLS